MLKRMNDGVYKEAKFVEVKPLAFSGLQLNIKVNTTTEIKEKETEKNNDRKLVYVGKDGWPVEGIIKMPFTTFLRRLFLTRKIMRYKTWRARGGCEINFS